MKRWLVLNSAAAFALIFTFTRCSPLAQSIPKWGQRAGAPTEAGTTLSLPNAPAQAPSQQVASLPGIELETAWVDVSRFRPSPLSASIPAAVYEATQSQLDEWVLSREFVAFQLREGERIARAQAVFRLDLSREQIERAEISQIQVALVPHPELPRHWVIRIVTGKESAVLESFDRLERITLRLLGESGVELHPTAPTLPEPIPESQGSEEQ